MKGGQIKHLHFYLHLRESPPPHNIPIPTPAPAPQTWMRYACEVRMVRGRINSQMAKRTKMHEAPRLCINCLGGSLNSLWAGAGKGILESGGLSEHLGAASWQRWEHVGTFEKSGYESIWKRLGASKTTPALLGGSNGFCGWGGTRAVPLNRKSVGFLIRVWLFGGSCVGFVWIMVLVRRAATYQFGAKVLLWYSRCVGWY